MAEMAVLGDKHIRPVIGCDMHTKAAWNVPPGRYDVTRVIDGHRSPSRYQTPPRADRRAGVFRFSLLRTAVCLP